jgi:hypothetical protein
MWHNYEQIIIKLIVQTPIVVIILNLRLSLNEGNIAW